MKRSWPQQALPLVCISDSSRLSLHDQKVSVDQIITDHEIPERALLKDPRRARGGSMGSLSGVCQGSGGAKWRK